LVRKSSTLNASVSKLKGSQFVSLAKVLSNMAFAGACQFLDYPSMLELFFDEIIRIGNLLGISTRSQEEKRHWLLMVPSLERWKHLLRELTVT